MERYLLKEKEMKTETYIKYYIEALIKLNELKTEDIKFPYRWETEDAIFLAISFTDVKVMPKKHVQFIQNNITILKTGDINESI